MPDRPTIICLTPVKNEAWILDRFLQCASLWADHIVVADQQSDDDTRAIAQRYAKVHLIENDSPAYDEAARQRLLLQAARAIPVEGKRLLLALDADEMLTANWMTSPEWARVLAAEPGTVAWFYWINVLPGVEQGWHDPSAKPFGYMDDGAPHAGYPIHSPRIPLRPGAAALHLRDVRVLHYQYTNWPRMRSKQRWYQCWERLHHPEKRPVTLYRQYHQMDVMRERAAPLRPEWLAGYEAHGIDMTTIPEATHYRWDEEVLAFFEQHGTAPFRKLNVWDRDWNALASALGHGPGPDLADPRSALERAVHAFLRTTQPHQGNPAVRTVQKLLQPLGW